MRPQRSRALMRGLALQGDRDAALARANGTRSAQGLAQLGLGIVVLAEGQSTLAQEALMSALDILHDVGDRTYEAYTLAYLGRLADSLGDYARAREVLERAVSLSEAVGSWEARCQAYVFLAVLLEHMGEHQAARRYAKQSLQIATQAGDRSRQADACLALGRVYEGMHQWAEAATSYQHAQGLYAQLGRNHMAIEPRAGMARIALAQAGGKAALIHRRHPRPGRCRP